MQVLVLELSDGSVSIIRNWDILRVRRCFGVEHRRSLHARCFNGHTNDALVEINVRRRQRFVDPHSGEQAPELSRTFPIQVWRIRRCSSVSLGNDVLHFRIFLHFNRQCFVCLWRDAFGHDADRMVGIERPADRDWLGCNHP